MLISLSQHNKTNSLAISRRSKGHDHQTDLNILEY